MKENDVSSKENQPLELIGFNRMEKSGLIIMLIIIITAPYLFTQWSSGIHFKGLGEIGDVIGGVTAPFVNLLAAYLVYKSFTAQIQANAQQRKDHNTQMNVILNEQTINFLMNLFNNIEKDYIENESSHKEHGWGNQLVEGFFKLDKCKEYLDKPKSNFDPITGTYHSNHYLRYGIEDIKISLPKVIFIYHNFSMLTDILLKSLTKTSDKNVIYTVRYITSKTGNLFRSNSYNFLLGKDIQSYTHAEEMKHIVETELNIAKEAAQVIESRLKALMSATEILLNK